jgi:NDP-sugar pyrophosphorylase family protein
VVPVAGTSERFRESAGIDVLKCLYHEGRFEDSLLYFAASYAKACHFEVVCFVGGYQYEQLAAAVEGAALRDLTADLELRCLFNGEYESKGTAQTVYLGLREIVDDPELRDVSEIVLLEGDVVADADTLEALAEEKCDVLSAYREPISAKHSVAMYTTTDGEVRFAYDPQHRSLTIPEPFAEIRNCGLAWKLADVPRVRDTMDALSTEDLDGSCLPILAEYFKRGGPYRMLEFREWVNCNTLADYRRARPLIRLGRVRWTP